MSYKSSLINFLHLRIYIPGFPGTRRHPQPQTNTKASRSNIRLIKIPTFWQEWFLIQETYGKKKYSWIILQITSTNKSWQCGLRDILLVSVPNVHLPKKLKSLPPQTVLIPTAILNLKSNVIPTVPMFGTWKGKSTVPFFYSRTTVSSRTTIQGFPVVLDWAVISNVCRTFPIWLPPVRCLRTTTQRIPIRTHQEYSASNFNTSFASSLFTKDRLTLGEGTSFAATLEEIQNTLIKLADVVNKID